MKGNKEFSFIRPVNRTKVRERLQMGAERLLSEFGVELDRLMSESDGWTQDDWKANAGLYADLQAVRKFVVDEDCFGFYETVDGRKKVRAGIESGLGLASRLLQRLTREGARAVARCILESYKLGVTWQARSGDKMDLAQLLLIDN